MKYQFLCQILSKIFPSRRG